MTDSHILRDCNHVRKLIRDRKYQLFRISNWNLKHLFLSYGSIFKSPWNSHNQVYQCHHTSNSDYMLIPMTRLITQPWSELSTNAICAEEEPKRGRHLYISMCPTTIKSSHQWGQGWLKQMSNIETPMTQKDSGIEPEPSNWYSATLIKLT